MLLERGDVNPDQPDTKYDRTPLSWAAESGYEGVVKMLLERNDVRTSTPDSTNQTSLSWALSKGHPRVVKMLCKRDSINSDTTDQVDRHPSPPPPATEPNAVDTPFRDPNELEPVSALKDSPPKPADHDQPPTEQSTLHQHPPIQTLEGADTRPNDAPSILAYTRPVDRYFTVACFVCLLAFLVYLLASSLPELF
ncbi:hypothetical protein HOY80DRAFT_898660 [Tuber brumale]|nr:hypothetical protein HOY80DRAFT_898660 [Tuber brumale]